MNDTTEIITTDQDVKIVEFNEFESKLAEFKTKYLNVVYDLSDEKQDKQARADRYAIGKVISALDDRHKGVKEPLLRKTKMLDGERKRIKDQLLDIQGRIKSQIEAHEELIRQKAAQLQTRVDQIAALSAFDHQAHSALIAERIAKLKAIVIDDSFEDRQGDAALAKDRAGTALEELLTATLAREKEARELEELRAEAERKRKEEELQRIEAEAKARSEREAAAAIAVAEARAKEAEAKAIRDQQEAERQAKVQAEAAERRIKEAEEREAKAKADAVIAAEKAKADAEARAKQEADRLKAQQEAEAKRIEDEKVKREQNKKHRESVMAIAVESLCEYGIPGSAARDAINAIAAGSVPNVQINF